MEGSIVTPIAAGYEISPTQYGIKKKVSGVACENGNIHLPTNSTRARPTPTILKQRFANKLLIFYTPYTLHLYSQFQAPSIKLPHTSLPSRSVTLKTQFPSAGLPARDARDGGVIES